MDNRTYEFAKLKRSAEQEYGIILDGRQDWSFFADDNNEFKLNPICEKCQFLKTCGQSFRAELVQCNRNKKVGSDKSNNKKKK